MEEEHNILIAACMDRRLNEKIIDDIVAKHGKGHVIEIRNGGPHLDALKETVEHLVKEKNIKEIYVYAHTNCGACNVVYGTFNKEITVSSTVYNGLVSQFGNDGKKFSCAQEIEEANIIHQKEMLKEFEDMGIETHIEYVDVAKLNLRDYTGEKFLIIGKPYSGTVATLAEKLGLDELSMYVINAESIVEVMPELEIAAINLGIKKFKIVAVSQDQNSWAEDEKKVLELDYMPFRKQGVEIEAVHLNL